MFPVYYIFNFLMTLLLILHVIWYYLITLIAYKVSSCTTCRDTCAPGAQCWRGHR